MPQHDPIDAPGGNDPLRQWRDAHEDSISARISAEVAGVASHPTADLIEQNRGTASGAPSSTNWQKQGEQPEPFDDADLLQGPPVEAASHDTPLRQNTGGWGTDAEILERQFHDELEELSRQKTGDVLPASPVDSPAVESPRTHVREVAKRLQKDGRWPEIEPVRDQMMQDKALKARLPDKESRQAWVYGELDRMYPPRKSDIYRKPGADTQDRQDSAGSDSGAIQGLSDIPKDWPELPANASLGSEIGWVQANRLWVVEERPGRATLVRLERAASPAPSRAAIGWLETSIRSYSKFVDVAAKVSGASEDEGAVMRLERKSIDEVRRLLAEMEAED